jgi:hypothetical protein
MWNAEASTFRMLGGLAARAGLSEHEIIAAATSGIAGVIAASQGEKWRAVPCRGARSWLCSTT